VITTWLTETFGLTIPLISAPMGGIADGAFANEVAQAGALGMIAAGTKATPEFISAESRKLSPGTRRFGIGTIAWVVEKKPDLLEAALAARPALVSISYGNYSHTIEPIHQGGAKATTQVGTLAEAREAEASGVDFLVVRGGEGGGHGRDEMATLPLLQEVLDNVDLPVVAAGGIANRRGLAAVLAAGAVGAWVGSAFLACTETSGSVEARKRIIAAGDGETIYTHAFDAGLQLDWPPEVGGRAIRNQFSHEWHDRDGVSQEGVDSMTAAVRNQDYEIAPIWAGQGIALLDREQTVRGVIDEFARAEEMLRQFLGVARLR
jgi:nitronate monooxygenase